jgi:hypothetical protein
VLLICLLLPACSLDCNGEAEAPTAPDKTEAWPLDSPLADHLPPKTRATLFLRRVDDIGAAADHVLATVPEDRTERYGPGRWLQRTGFAAGRLGVAGEAPAALFGTPAGWGVVAPLADPSALQGRLDRLDADEEWSIEKRGEGRWRVARRAVAEEASESDDGGAETETHTDTDTATAPADPPDLPTGPLADLTVADGYLTLRTIGSEPAARPTARPVAADASWPSTERARSLLEDLVDSPTEAGAKTRAVGLVEPGDWMRSDGATGQAAVLLSRMVNQLGPTALRLTHDAERGELAAELHSRSDPGEPTVISEVGPAEGDLPALGGLVEPGVLGVLRFSVDPKAVYRLFVSTLPARRRQQLEMFWEQMDSKLLVDGPDGLLDNFTGHVVLVFYGLDGEQLSTDEGLSARQMLTLQPTSEAILLPIKSRKKAERLLDKLTQITKGKLSRQRGEHTVQYAWLADGVLEWAFILSDEHILFVDSATAFGQAMHFERRGRPLTAEQIETLGIGPLLERRDRSGLYLDTGTLANLLAENGHQKAAAWLVPFRSLLLTTEMTGGVSRMRVVFRL